MPEDFTHRVALVTGAFRGFGRAMLSSFVEERSP